MRVLIIGSGLAGSVAALKAAELGAEVTIVTQEDAASAWAQGGIVYRAEGGDPVMLKSDILKAGANLNNIDAVDFVLSEGPRLVEEWFQKKFPIPFDVQKDGRWALGLEGAHSARRILHISDQTGAAMLAPLRKAIASHEKIKCINGDLVELLLSSRHSENKNDRYQRPRCFGAYIMVNGKVIPIEAEATLLATGGYSGLYLHSSGPKSNFGAGIACAWTVGARTLDLEFVQFHPTTLFVEGKPRRLLTEALRGEGAKILNYKGEQFVDEMAARDVVARAIHSEMAATQRPCVYLDLRGIKDLEEKFQQVVATLKENNFNPREDLIPIVPAAHYTMGGVWTDLEASTSLPGLWAAGEVACTGLHGANRLASMSLLETLVFGDAAAKSMMAHSVKVPHARAWVPAHENVDSVLVQQDWSLLRQTLWNYVGIVRSDERLARAKKIIEELNFEIEDFYKMASLTPQLLALRQGIIVGTLTVQSALRRKESVGTHFKR
jgi:L-aspartate oxidase